MNYPVLITGGCVIAGTPCSNVIAALNFTLHRSQSLGQCQARPGGAGQHDEGHKEEKRGRKMEQKKKNKQPTQRGEK